MAIASGATVDPPVLVKASELLMETLEELPPVKATGGFTFTKAFALEYEHDVVQEAGRLASELNRILRIWDIPLCATL